MSAYKSSIFDLLSMRKLAIPDYQRPYKWTKRNIEEQYKMANREIDNIYITRYDIERINNSIERSIKKTKGDIFEAFICIYDYMVNECMNKKEVQFFKKIFEGIKTSEDDFFVIDLKKHKPKTMEEYYDLIDKSNLKIEGKEDFKLLIRILQAVTKKAIVSNFKYKSKKQAKLDYLKQLDYIKHGIIKPKEGGNNV